MKSGFENGRRVPVTEDSIHPGEEPADQVRELEVEFHLTEEERGLVEITVRARLFEAQCDVLRKLCFLVKDARYPRRMIYQLMYAAGMGAACGGSSASLAEKFGVSRQAFEQEAARLLESLEMRKAPLEKKPEASAKYKQANYTRPPALTKGMK